MAAYQTAGPPQDVEAITRRMYAEHPDYFFARVAMAEHYLVRRELEKVPEAFGDKYDLQAMYPHRNVFHIPKSSACAGFWADILPSLVSSTPPKFIYSS